MSLIDDILDWYFDILYSWIFGVIIIGIGVLLLIQFIYAYKAWDIGNLRGSFFFQVSLLLAWIFTVNIGLCWILLNSTLFSSDIEDLLFSLIIVHLILFSLPISLFTIGIIRVTIKHGIEKQLVTVNRRIKKLLR